MKIMIIGAGIGGLTAAIALQRRGISVKVYENTPEFKPLGAGLILAANAMKALEVIGISEPVLQAGKLLQQGSILSQDGTTLNQINVEAITRQFGTHNFVIHRAALHQILLSRLQAETLVYGKRCIRVAQDTKTVTATFADGTTAQADCLLASDGVHSAIRQQLLPDSGVRYAGYTCWRAVVEADARYVDFNRFTETWGAKGRFGIAPLTGSKVYWFACINATQNSPEMKQKTITDLADAFSDYHDPIPYLLSITSTNQLIHNDIIDIHPLEHLAFGRILLLGDAGHATTPNMGQGACQAIEDAAVLMKQLGQETSIERDLIAFEHKRLKRTEKINTLSWQIGKIAQVSNPFLVTLRNGLMRLVPQRINDSQLTFLYDVTF